MPSTVEQLSPSRAKITVEVPFSDLKPHLDKAYKEIAQQVQIPGFRPGHVPAAIIDSRFGPGVALEQALNEALPGLYGAAVDEHVLHPLAQPEIEVTKLEVGQTVEFTAEVDVRPDFTLPDFSSIAVQVEPVESTDDELEEQVTVLRERFATDTEVDRPAAEGDAVTFDLTATRDGEPVEGGAATDVAYVVGSGGMVEGMDEALTGLKAGESATFTSTLVGGPAEGQEAQIEVTVSRVATHELPEVDDDFAQMVSEFDTVDEMREDLRSNLERVHRVEQANGARDDVLKAVIDQIDLEVPESVLASEVEARNQQVDQELGQAGMTLKQYLADEEGEQTEEEFRADLAARSADAVKAQIILDKIAEESEVSVEQSDLTEYLFQRARANRTTPDQEMQHMLEHNHLQEWMTEIRRSKALGLIVAEAQVTDTTGAPVDMSVLRSEAAEETDNDDLEEEDLDEEDDVEAASGAEVDDADEDAEPSDAARTVDLGPGMALTAPVAVPAAEPAEASETESTGADDASEDEIPKG